MKCIPIILGLFLGFSQAFSSNWDGSTALTNPADTIIDGKEFYQITSANELAWFAQQVNTGKVVYNAILVNDIVLFEDSITKTAIRWTPIGKTSAYAFQGTFKGNNKIISGLYLNDTLQTNSDTLALGLFGFIGKAGKISDLTISNSLFLGYFKEHSGTVMTAAFAGYNSGIVQNCINQSSVSGDTLPSVSSYSNTYLLYIGGIVGYNAEVLNYVSNYGNISSDGGIVGGIVGYDKGTLNYVSNYGNISSRGYSGGIVGLASSSLSKISNAVNQGTISGITIGGISGYGPEITQAVNNGALLGSFDGTTNVGGICGRDCNISNSTNTGTLFIQDTGSIRSSVSVGGICGESCDVNNSTNTGNISIQMANTRINVGGIIGNSAGLSISYNVNEGVIIAKNTNAKLYAGGIVGYYRGSLKNCTNKGNISAQSSFRGTSSTTSVPTASTGGIVGYYAGYSYYFEKNANYGIVSTQAPEAASGGIVGSNENEVLDIYKGTIQNCFNRGKVFAKSENDTSVTFSYAGGIVGFNAGIVKNCYSATDTISAEGASVSYTGNIAGFNKVKGKIISVYFDTSLSLTKSAFGEDVSDSTLYVFGFPTDAMQSDSVAVMLNTTYHTLTNSKTWSRNGFYPIFADSAHFAINAAASIFPIEARPLSLFITTTDDGMIQIQNAPQGAELVIFDLRGHVVHQSIINHSIEFVPFSNKGVYFLKIGRTSRKININ